MPALTLAHLATYTPSTNVIGHSITLTALVALIPLLTFFILLGVVKLRSHYCAIGALVVALLVAIIGYHMPAGLAVLAATQGAAFGLFPILWIVIMAIWLYRLTVTSGRDEDMKAVFSAVGKGDIRIQAVLIAFCFGGILEALAGFGAPVAIVAALLVALGLEPIKAAVVTLVANTAPVAFGAMAIPITTAGGILSGEDKAANAQAVASGVASQIPIVAVVVPLLLLALLDGKRGVKELWPLGVVVGVVGAVMQWVGANFISYELTAVISSLCGLGAAVVLLAVWKPTTPEEFVSAQVEVSGRRTWLALFPYILVVIVFGIAKLIHPVTRALASTDVKVAWPGLHGHLLKADGSVSEAPIFSFTWLSNPGTMLFVSCVIIVAVYAATSQNGRFPMSGSIAVKTLGRVIVDNRLAILTISCILALSYVMNFSGQTTALGTWLAQTGSAFVVLSPILGWIGTAVTGSDTSANALFTGLQETAAHKIGVSPYVTAAANTSGGVIGKLISPQNLTIAASAIQEKGAESTLLRKVAPFSLAMLAAVCVIVAIQTGAFF